MPMGLPRLPGSSEDRWRPKPSVLRKLRFHRDVAAGGYHLEPFGSEDLDRAADVIERYGDQDIGLADASNVVLAEHHGTSSILTLDERHFRALRGPGGEPFHLLPTDY